MENLRKRQLESCPTSPSKNEQEPPKKTLMDALNEQIDETDAKEAGKEPKCEKTIDFPILTSMISAPPVNVKNANATTSANGNAPPVLNYVVIFNAFRQFLQGYLAAGGDPNLANTLATYAASLPMPPNPLKPLNALPPPPLPIGVKQEAPLTSRPTSPTQMETSHEKSEKTEAEEQKEDVKPTLPLALPMLPMIAPPPPPASSRIDEEVTSEIQRLREAAFGRYKNVLCVICNEWICSRNRKNHIEAHLNYRPYKCSACDYARRREIFVVQHIKTHHVGQKGVEMKSAVDLNVALEVDRLADECVERTRKLIESMQEKKDGDFGESQGFDEKALELMLAEEAENKVVVIESVSEVRAKVANYHRRQRTRVLKKIYNTDAAKQTELKIVKEETVDEEPGTVQVAEGNEIKLEDLMKMVGDDGDHPEESRVKQEIFHDDEH
ncbi:unnamed protein product [Caenorhabditis sp. 36 PRJEB53466]|nr:unnamed protein product [Caenorhabditis sp. 36 PRJEB53466]